MKTIEFNPANWIDNTSETLAINESKMEATIKRTKVKFRLVDFNELKDDDGEIEFLCKSYRIELNEGNGWEKTDWHLMWDNFIGDYWIASNWNYDITRDHKNKFVAVAQLIMNIY